MSSGGNKTYMKLKEVGESVVGVLKRFQQDVEGNYGPETLATLESRDGDTIILRCQTVLGNIIAENEQELMGKVIRPVMTGEGKPKKGGYPAKLFDVDFWDTWEEAEADGALDADSFPPAGAKAAASAAATEEAELEAKLAAARARRAAAGAA